jgi:hypothetical protein
MQDRIGEREEPDEPAERDRPRVPGEDPERRQCEAREQQAQRPLAQRVGDEVDRIRPKIAGERADAEKAEWTEAGQPDGGLEDDAAAPVQ